MFYVTIKILILDGNESEDEKGSDDKEDEDGELNLSFKPLEANLTAAQLLAKAEQLKLPNADYSRVIVCCACLGDRSDSVNEIVECDGCGVMVHEGKI